MTASPWPPTPSVETSAGTIAFVDEGDGPPVLFLHGFPASSRQWRELLPLFSSRFRAIAPDLPGAGASIPAAGVTLDLSTQAGAIAELLVQLGIDRYAIVAHGAGAGVAQLLALDGGGVDALVLLSAATLDAWPSNDIAKTRHLVSSALHSTTNASPSAAVRDAVHDAVRRGAVRHDRLGDDVLDLYAAPYVEDDGPERFVRVLDGLDGRGLASREDELARIDSPVLIMWGEEDPVYPPGVGERLNEAMPASTLALLPGCGHFLVEEAAGTIGPLIAEYLRMRYLHAPHGHGSSKEGIVTVQLERRPPWVDLAEDERDDWFDVDEAVDEDDPKEEGGSSS